jgi:hypothetical protein
VKLILVFSFSFANEAHRKKRLAAESRCVLVAVGRR